MRVALVQPKFDTSGGAERYALALAVGLSARGHEVHLFGRKTAPLPKALAFHRVSCLPLGRTVKTWSFDAAATLRVRGRGFDVVQGFGKTRCQTVHRAGGGVHRAYVEREEAELSAYDRVAIAIEDRLFSSPRLRAVIAPSLWVRRELERFYPAVAPRIRVIPNGVDTKRFSPRDRGSERERFVRETGFPAGAALLLFAAANFELKGLGRVIETLGLLPGACLAVAGDDAPGPFQEVAAARGVGERVRFLGRIEDMSAVYRAADLLLHPTRYDPFANVCLEAMACGTPVVTTDRNGAADLLAKGGGEVVPGDADPGRIAESVRRVMEFGSAAGERAREIAEGCDSARHIESVEAIYRAAARQPASPSGV